MVQPIGYFKLWRELITKPIWLNSTPEQCKILITLLAMANFNGKEWEWKGSKYKAEKGQFVTSISSIVKNCGSGVTSRNVRTSLDRFVKYDFLTNEVTNAGRLITILNWELYQRDEDKVTNKLTSERQTSDKRVTNEQASREEVKKDKKERNKDIYTLEFEKVYKSFPRPQAKTDTFKNWNFLLKEYTVEQLIKYAFNYINYYNSIPEQERPYAYSSNNFFGKKMYFEDFKVSKTWTSTKKQTTVNSGNFEQRQYDDDYYNKLYKNVRGAKA